MRDVRQCITLATIWQKIHFGHNFCTKPLRRLILVPAYVFEVKEFNGVIIFYQQSWLFKLVNFAKEWWVLFVLLFTNRSICWIFSCVLDCLNMMLSLPNLIILILTCLTSPSWQHVSWPLLLDDHLISVFISNILSLLQRKVKAWEKCYGTRGTKLPASSNQILTNPLTPQWRKRSRTS